LSPNRDKSVLKCYSHISGLIRDRLSRLLIRNCWAVLIIDVIISKHTTNRPTLSLFSSLGLFEHLREVAQYSAVLTVEQFLSKVLPVCITAPYILYCLSPTPAILCRAQALGSDGYRRVRGHIPEKNVQGMHAAAVMLTRVYLIILYILL